MSKIQESVSLKDHNSFHLPVHTKFFIIADNINDVISAITYSKQKKLPILFLGDGANILFTKDYEGIVVKNNLKGIKIVEETSDNVTLEVASGEDWPKLVEYSVDNNWIGIENLATIPGTVGAAPIQNIAAYGQNLEDSFVSLEAFEITTNNIKVFTKEECCFKYRSSTFKQELKDKYFIVSVRLKLSKHFYGIDSSYHSRYESLEGELRDFATQPYTLKDIYTAVVRIRQKKLPDVNKVGTVGSTFANPFITRKQLNELQKTFPDIQFYPTEKMQYPKLNNKHLQDMEIVKLPAGWLLEEAGWKGKRTGYVGTHPNHALCVVTYDGANPEDVYTFTERMRKDFKDKYKIDLQYEVNVI